MKTPISRLVLRRDEIPRSTAVTLIEQKLGRPLTHTHRHYLADRPVHCGDMLMIWSEDEDTWVMGRYEWTGRLHDEATLDTAHGCFLLDESLLLRWPTKGD